MELACVCTLDGTGHSCMVNELLLNTKPNLFTCRDPKSKENLMYSYFLTTGVDAIDMASRGEPSCRTHIKKWFMKV